MRQRHVIQYTSDGEVRQEFSVVYTARAVGGEPAPSDESSEVRWMNPNEIAALPMHASMRQRIEHFHERRETPYLG